MSKKSYFIFLSVVAAFSVIYCVYGFNIKLVEATNASATASCTAFASGQSATFTSAVSGAASSYAYSWSGDCTGTGPSCSNTFDASGTKTATVTVTSISQAYSQASATCSVYVNVCTGSCSTNSQCGTNGPNGGLFCQGNNVYQNYITYTCNNPGTCQSSCTNSTVPQLQTTCTGNQTCTNGACVNQNIACHTNSDCGTNGIVGSPFCQGNNVYQNYKTYTCNNPGTAQSSCTNSTAAQLQTTCTGNQTCSNGSCTNLNIACHDNDDCGTSGFIGDAFCQGNSVYKNYKTYTCNNPGTAQSSCTNSTAAQLQTTCTGNQTCSNGSCMPVSCQTNSDCGTNGITGGLFCQGNNVYQNYITYTCNNPGTAQSSCTNSTAAQLQTTCTGNQTCSNGSCTNSCTSNYQERCNGNNLYWYDSCGNQQGLIQYCPNGCSGNTCQNNYYNTCTYHSYERCNGNNLYWYDSCGNQQDLIQYCQNGCSGNTCQNYYNYNYINSCTSNYQERCNGNNLYWYDSCGNQQGLIQYCPNGCSGNTCQNYGNGTLTVTKTVRDLTTGTGFASSTYASPSDVLMFMITLQASGNQDVQNVIARDTLPANLIYNNQLIVARSNNASNNYSGDIVSGLNLNTISSGQTVTITYQTQVAGAANFTYGTTTLNNSVSVTSSASGYTPTASASVVVTRATVLGASTVSTGLTNNFWVDSFFLPLLLTLIGIWMWRVGMFFGIEKWIDNKKKIRRSYKAEKELSARIASIQKTAKI